MATLSSRMRGQSRGTGPTSTRTNSPKQACLICNTILSSRSQKAEFLEDVCILFKLFDMNTTPGTRLSKPDTLSQNPYCANCSKKIKHLKQLMGQLEEIQKRIQTYRDEIRQSIVETFMLTPRSGTAYQWKQEIFEHLGTEGQCQTEADVHLQNPNSFSSTSNIANTQSQSQPPQDNYEPVHEENVSTDVTYSPAEHFEDLKFDVHPENEVIISISSGQTRKIASTSSTKSKPRPQRVSNDSSLRREIMKNQITQCPFCSKSFSVPINLARHVTLHTGHKPYSCSFCDMRFRDSTNKKRHEERRHRTDLRRGATCDICGKVYGTYEGMYSHKRFKHFGKKKFGTEKVPSECNICGKVMNCQRNLNTHIRVIHHLQFKTILCPICGRPGKTRQEINSHQETHKSLWELQLEGKTFFYNCTKCSLTFPSRASLASHRDFDHPGVEFPKTLEKPNKPYKCLECPDNPGYANATNLRAHIAAGHKKREKKGRTRHVRERKFLCQICSKPFSYNSEAKLHERTHDPARNNHFPYSCSKCPPISGLFKRRDDFTNHYQTEHPMSEIPKMKKNSAKRPLNYVCEVCPHNPKFTSRKGLNKHVNRGHPLTSGRKRKVDGKKRKKSHRRKVSSSEESTDTIISDNDNEMDLDCVKVEIASNSENEDDNVNDYDQDEPFVNLTRLKQYPVVVLPRLRPSTNSS